MSGLIEKKQSIQLASIDKSDYARYYFSNRMNFL